MEAAKNLPYAAQVNGKEFKRAVRLAKMFTSNDEKFKRNLTCVCVRCDDGIMQLMASNGHYCAACASRLWVTCQTPPLSLASYQGAAVSFS